MVKHDMETHHPLEMENLSYGQPRYFGQINHRSSVGSYDRQFGGIKKGTWFLLDQAPTTNPIIAGGVIHWQVVGGFSSKQLQGNRCVAFDSS